MFSDIMNSSLQRLTCRFETNRISAAEIRNVAPVAAVFAHDSEVLVWMIICFLKALIDWQQVCRILWLVVCESDLTIIEFGNESVDWMAHQIDERQIEWFRKVEIVEVASVDKSFVWIFYLKIWKLLYQSFLLVFFNNFWVILFVVKPLGKSVIALSKRVKKLTT